MFNIIIGNNELCHLIYRRKSAKKIKQNSWMIDNIICIQKILIMNSKKVTPVIVIKNNYNRLNE